MDEPRRFHCVVSFAVLSMTRDAGRVELLAVSGVTLESRAGLRRRKPGDIGGDGFQILVAFERPRHGPHLQTGDIVGVVPALPTPEFVQLRLNIPGRETGNDRSVMQRIALAVLAMAGAAEF